LTDLRVGRHELRITGAGYRDYVGSFTITGQYSVLVVTSDPVGAEVYLDGVLQGRTTESGLALSRVPYGERKLTARAPGYRDVDKTIDVRSPGPMAVSFRLGWGKGFVQVESDPTGARVSAGGRPLGESPMLIELDPARYMLTMTKPGYYDWIGYTQVQFAETVFVLAELDRIKTRKLPLLLLGLAGVAGTAYAAYRGQTDYAQEPATRSEAEYRQLQQAVQRWDLYRDVGAAFSAGMIAVYMTVRW
jgi:hypothetical protein